MATLSQRIVDYVADAIARTVQAVTAVGTVVAAPTTSPLTVLLDGSAVTVQVKALRVVPVAQGMRVALVKFGSDWTVVGAFAAPSTVTGAGAVIAAGTGEATGSTTNATSTPTLIAGTLVTLANLSASADYAVATAAVDFTQVTSSGTIAVVDLIVNGSAVPREVVFAGVTAGVRGTFYQQWRFSLNAVNPANTFQLRVTKAAGTDNHILVSAVHTNLYVQILEGI